MVFGVVAGGRECRSFWGRSAGVSECWSSGGRSSGVSECWSSGGRSAGVSGCRSFGVPECRSTGGADMLWGKEKDRMDKTLVSGSMAMLLLKLLEEGDKYGYEMIEALRQRSQNVFELKAGTLYPLLHGLEEKGLLTSYEKKVGGKVRKYYSITTDGRKALKAREEEWREYSRAVLNVLA